MKNGHIVRFCRVRRFSIPKGILKWVPWVFKVPKLPTNIIGPTFIRGPNLASLPFLVGILESQELHWV